MEGTIEPKQLIDLLLDKYYSELSTYEEKIEALYNELGNITAYINAYGDTHEKAVINYCTYKQDMVILHFRRKEH